MKIGYFNTLFPYDASFKDSESYRNYPVGGAEKWAYHLSHEMVKLGHEVIVFTTSADCKSRVLNENGVKVYRYGTNLKLNKAFISIDMFIKSLEHEVDIVDIHFTVPPAYLAGLFYTKIKKPPLVVTYHGDADPTYGNLIRRLGLSLSDWFIVDNLLATAKHIITYSEYYISTSKILPKYENKIIPIPGGINPAEIELPYTKNECRSKLSLSVNDKIILFVGALINYKSPDLVIEALPFIINKIPDAKVMILGDGPMREYLKKLTDSLGLSENVRFTGNVVGELKALYYNAADVFTLPSTGRTESFGMVLLEAAVAGLPIVVSSMNCFRSFIEDKYNGILTKTGDVNSLAEALALLLADSFLRQTIGENARNKVKDYSWGNIARKVENVYKNAMIL